ncbi:MAG: tetratricopeptide repeat protein [Candidatus Brocadia sp.]|nr:tetratricopeptide repeat protein [Candidatus Brocadia sp.]
MYNSYQPINKHGAVKVRSDKPRLYICQLVLIIVVSSLLYLYTVGNNFVYDDKFTVVNNYLIRSWYKVPMIFTSDYFTAAGELSYRPLVTLSYFVDYSFWHLNPVGYHLTNLFLHSLNAALLFFLLARLLGILGETHRESIPVFPRNSEASVSRTVAIRTSIPFLASLIFCTHPLLAEAVNAISYREDLLATTFYFAAFQFYLKTCQQRSTLWYSVSLLCYLAGLFSKETTITFPVLIGLYDVLSQSKTRLPYKLIRYYIGYALVSIFYILIRFVFLHNPTESYIPYPQNSLWVNFLTMSKVLASYIKLLFFPVNLNADYVVQHTTSPVEISFILSLLLIVSVMVIAYRLFFYFRILFFSVLWFFITLLPVLNIIPIENIMAERYLYLSLVGFCVLGGFLLDQIPNLGLRHRVLNSCGFTFIITLLLIGFSWQTCQISKIWFDDHSLWSTTAERSPQSSRAHNNLGVLYKKMGFMDAAIREYTMAIQIKPDYSEAHGNLANVYINKGLSVLDKQTLSKAHNNLSKAYIDEGNFKTAITEYKKSLEISPFNETAHFNLGVTYGKMGLFSNAEIEYGNVIRINKNNPHAHNNLGNIYEDKGLLDKAMAAYQVSLSIDPNSAITHNNIGNVYFKKGVFDAAILEYRAATENDPEGIVYHENLGNAYVKKGLVEEAITEFESIIGMYPKNANAYGNLITLCWNYKKDSEKAILYLRKLSVLEPEQREAINKMIEKIGIKK